MENNKRQIGGDPKQVFRLLPRPAVTPVCKGEHPKAFFRRMAAREQLANPNPAQAVRA